MRKFYYSIFGLSFESELVLPNLREERFKHSNVKIRIGKNPTHLPEVLNKGILYEASRNDFLFHLDGIGSYRVENGEIITIDPNEKANESEIRLFLFGTTMGALLHQRGFLPLHGSAIEVDNQALIIIGNSAAGKSTIAAGYAEKGFSIISDDISALKIDSELDSYVQPGLPFLKLWRDSLTHLKCNGEFERVRPQIQKYIKPLNQSFCSRPIKVTNIICLGTKNNNGFTHEVITGAQKFNLLRNHTYRLQFVNSMGIITDHFHHLSTLTEKTTLYKVERPDSPIKVFDLINYIGEYVI